eukprot:m.7669 g.7669  ORF g.7669 m.7669 type:complete len:244 (+) comp3013_c0_seq1:181-912(+)
MSAENTLRARGLDPRLNERHLEKIFGKHGKITHVALLKHVHGPQKGKSRCEATIEFEHTEDAEAAMKALDGRKALNCKMAVTWATRYEAPLETQIEQLEGKLHRLEKGIDSVMEGGPVAHVRNKNVFSRGGSGPAIWHGKGVTRTKPSQTLFVTNFPKSRVHELEAVFNDDAGFFAFRTKRGLAFVDYESIEAATRSMIAHQGHRLPGMHLEHGGFVIDFDRDQRTKRNKAYERQRGGAKAVS